MAYDKYRFIAHSLWYCSYVPNPVLVIIDVQPKELGIPTKAYYDVEEVKEVELTSFLCSFYVNQLCCFVVCDGYY